jgi:hypothetical protein
MPFTDSGRFYHNRRIEQQGDTWKLASEQLAKHIETYLFDEGSAGYLKPEFLSWALSVYDATKNSTGNVDIPPFDDDLMTLKPAGKPGTRDLDKSVRFDENARQSSTVDTDRLRAEDNGFTFPTGDEPEIGA